MNMQEVVRLLMGLREIGLSEKEINDFLIYIGSGNEDYKPKRQVVEAGAPKAGS